MRPVKTREDRVADLMARGLNTVEIGAHMNLTKGQVARAIQNVKRAMGAQAI